MFNMEDIMEKKHLLISIGLVFLALILLFTTGCGKNTVEGTIDEYNFKETEDVTNYVKLVTDEDEVVLIELYPEIAPITVKNFQDLVSEKYYDGLIFHRVIDNFMIQTGDPTGTGYGGSEKTIKGEFSSNGVKNELKHEHGVVSMARQSNDMDSASSQIFICASDEVDFLDGDYAAFGRVIAGYSAIERISKVETDSYDKPLVKEMIESVRFVEVNKNE